MSYSPSESLSESLSESPRRQALAWEVKSAEGFEPLYDGGPPAGERRRLFPLARPEARPGRWRRGVGGVRDSVSYAGRGGGGG